MREYLRHAPALRSAELPLLSVPALAAELRTSPDTVRRALVEEADHAG